MFRRRFMFIYANCSAKKCKSQRLKPSEFVFVVRLPTATHLPFSPRFGIQWIIFKMSLSYLRWSLKCVCVCVWVAASSMLCVALAKRINFPTGKSVGQPMSNYQPFVAKQIDIFAKHCDFSPIYNCHSKLISSKRRESEEHCSTGFVCNLPTQYVLIIAYDAIGGLQLIHVNATSSQRFT